MAPCFEWEAELCELLVSFSRAAKLNPQAALAVHTAKYHYPPVPYRQCFLLVKTVVPGSLSLNLLEVSVQKGDLGY